jgi:hypothetical protein
MPTGSDIGGRVLEKESDGSERVGIERDIQAGLPQQSSGLKYMKDTIVMLKTERL